jgi:hypothetical protein
MHGATDRPANGREQVRFLAYFVLFSFLGSDVYIHVPMSAVGLMGISGMSLLFFPCEDNTSACNCTYMHVREHVREFRLDEYMYTWRGCALIGSADC